MRHPITIPRRPPRPGAPRWAALGAAVAVTLCSGGLMTASASVSSGTRAVFVPIAPCRLVDTRPPTDQVGPRSSPLGPGEVFTQQATGTNGNCTIPADAVAVSLNITAVGGTAASFLTVFPANAAQPVSANLNWTAGAAPTPNKVDVGLSTGGAFKVFNFAGTVNLVADVAGFYVDHTHDDRYYTKAETDTKLASATGEVVAVADSGAPPFTPQAAQLTMGTTTFTTTKSGRLHVTLHVAGSLVCSLQRDYDGWLVVDGVIVANSRRNLGSTSTTPVAPFGLLESQFPAITLEGITATSVAAGLHTMEARFACKGTVTADAQFKDIIFSGFAEVLPS